MRFLGGQLEIVASRNYFFLALAFPLLPLPLEFAFAFPLAGVSVVALALSSLLLTLVSLRFSPLFPGATIPGFFEVVVDEPMVIEPMVEEVTLGATVVVALVVEVEVPTLVVLVVDCLCLPQSLLAASLRRLPFGCEETHAP